jgi:transposase InsO family protein
LTNAKRICRDFIEHYNSVRLHSAIGFLALGPPQLEAYRKQTAA